MARGEKRAVKASHVLARMQQDIRSLNSSILIITQKMKYVVRNEKILGRNLIVLNKKLKTLEESGGGTAATAASLPQLQEMQQQADDLSSKLTQLQVQLDDLQQSMASKEELQEMRYVVESINPLQFVTLEQAKDLLQARGRKPRKKKRKKRKP